MKYYLVILFVLFGFGCSKETESESGKAKVDSDTPKQVMMIDKQARKGRTFVYIDDTGNTIKTANYDEIPVDKRNAVMVIEGRRRARVSRTKKGKFHIEALPPTITSEEKAGQKEAKAVLEANPPEDGPPSTDKWTEEQWRKELKKELEELQAEQEKE